MNNFKDMLKISDRDKRLLLIVAAFGIVALAYFFGFTKLNTLADTLSEDRNKLVKTEKDLREKNNNKDKYIKDTRTFSSLYSDILTDYESDTTQPSAIDYFNKIESTTNTWIKSASFAQPSAIYSFGKGMTSNPNKPNEIAYSTDMIGYETVLTIAYEGSYENWKSMISYINTYYSKCTINNMSSSYSDANDIVSGSMEVSVYAIKGKDRVFKEPTFDVKTGAGNIFSSVQRKATK